LRRRDLDPSEPNDLDRSGRSDRDGVIRSIRSDFDSVGSLSGALSSAMVPSMGGTASTDATDRIRVALGEMPMVVAEIVRQALVDADIDVFALNQELSSKENEPAADVVILPGERGAIPAQCQRLLARGARTRVLTLMTDAERADLYELRLVGSNVGVEGVVAAVRAVVQGVQ
jgi:hypothetical protein